MSGSIIDPGDPSALKYIITHVFFPLQLPDGDDHSIHNDHSLARAIASVAQLHGDHVSKAIAPQWQSISQMLNNLRAVVRFESLDRSRTISQLSDMKVGGKFRASAASWKLTTCRCPDISHPSSECGRRV